MSIEETYKGMWSSDPSLLKSLLDAGNTIVTNHGSVTWADGGYWISTAIGPMPKRYENDSHLGFSFLIPPRPLVLEPKPLEWTEVDDENGECLESKDGLFWDFWCWSNGDWGIELDGAIVAENTSKGNFDTAKAAIHEWRVNHLKSMLP